MDAATIAFVMMLFCPLACALALWAGKHSAERMGSEIGANLGRYAVTLTRVLREYRDRGGDLRQMQDAKSADIPRILRAEGHEDLAREMESA